MFVDSQGKTHLTFNEATRQAFLQLQPIVYAPNSSFPITVTQVGFLSRILVPIEIDITTGNAGTYSNKSPIFSNAGTTGNDVPTPFNIIQAITLQTNEGAQIHNTSGYGNYLLARTRRTNHDIVNPISAFNSSNADKSVFLLPASYTTNTSYKIRFMLDVPVALTEANNAGLILIQNLTTRLQLQITWGDIAANLLNLSGGATITVNNVSAVPTMIFFNVPNDPASYPDLSYNYINIEDYNVTLTQGNDIYRPQLNNAYLQIITQYVNNGVNMIPATDFGNSQLTFQAIQNPYNITNSAQQFLQQERLGGQSLPDGCIWWDFTFGTGIPEIYNPRDVINTAALTDLQIIQQLNPAGGITGVNYKRSIRSMLAKV
jgi:hypothetical protein